MTGNEQQAGPRATRRRDKLSPDPAVRRAILAAAVEITREDGVRNLGIAGVLERCGLGTRAFYRHFASKDELLEALFLESARTETRRLQRSMKTAGSAVEAVAAWIDGRLDLAFDQNIKSDLRALSEEAQSLMFSSPRLVQAAFGELLKPLVEQLERGLADGVFDDIDPVTDAQIIQGAVWACTERQWVAGDSVRSDVRTRALRSCLRGLGVAPETVTAVLAARAG
jgi:AcrR family transcriptional regulator